ncbi:E3 ubiquitin-protein ligase TRIM39-like [Polymixia lowei]
MATASSLLSEEPFLCSVCLDVFTEPVTTSCGHNFCNSCIQKYWDSNDICQCPMCKRTFSTRPELQVNSFISELAVQFRKSVQAKALLSDPCTASTEVPCDICSEIKVKALKSCLVCLTSLCEAHLEPHLRVAGLKSHTLIDPVLNLDDRMCKRHNRLVEVYCRTDQTCICVLCIKTDHKSHNIVPLEEEYEANVAKIDETVAKVQEMIHSRSGKISEIEISVGVSKKEAEREKAESAQVFTDLFRSIEKSQAELVEVIEERLKETKQKAGRLITELKMEIAELKRRSTELEQLSQSEDHHDFIRCFSAMGAPLSKEWRNIVIEDNLSVGTVRAAVSNLQETLDQNMEQLPEIKMKRIREHAVEITLDPDTAHCELILSQDGKQVRHGARRQNLPDNPKRFEDIVDVLAKEGFTTGKFYYEVEVKGKTEWVVGVVRESIDRKGRECLSVTNGFWAIALDEGKYEACTRKRKILTLKEKPQKIGVFVDYTKGEVSFYDADSKCHVHSFTGNYFLEKLYPYFSPQENDNGANSAPLIITPVHQPD